MQLIARFTISGWEEQDVSAIGEGWLDAGRMGKTFTAGLTGDSVLLFVSSGTEGRRAYLAVERIAGRTDDGRSGSVTVHHGGLESSADASFGHIVPGSGTDDFADWAGPARIEHDEQGAFFVFDLP